MNSNPYETSPQNASPRTATRSFVRWFFLVDFSFFCLHIANTWSNWLRPSLEGPFGDLSNPGIALAYIAVIGRLILVPLSDFSAWQQRQEAKKYLKIAAFVTGLQIAVGTYQIAVWLWEHAARVGIAALADDPFVETTLLDGFPLAAQAIYNAVFYYWAINRARTAHGAT
jgi:hypothetical protein